jgi:uncharacterized protein YbjT (DUF2867 family)
MEVVMILITGASGNVGAEVLRQTLKTGAKVRAAFQSPDKASTAPSGVEIAIMDYNQPETVRQALTGVDRIFLVAPVVPNIPDLENNVVTEARKAGIRHIVKFSAIGGRDSIFPRLHTESEDRIKASGIPYTFLRANGFMQNLVIYNLGTINAQNAFYGSQGDSAVSYVDLRDVGAIAARVLTDPGHEGQAYEITGPAALTNHQMAEILSDDIGRTIKYVDLPPDQLAQGMRAAGIPEFNIKGILDLNAFYAAGKAQHISDDFEKVLKRKPTSFEQFSRDHRNVFKEESKAAS